MVPFGKCNLILNPWELTNSHDLLFFCLPIFSGGWILPQSSLVPSFKVFLLLKILLFFQYIYIQYMCVCVCVCMYAHKHIFFIHSSADGYLACFYIFPCFTLNELILPGENGSWLKTCMWPHCILFVRVPSCSLSFAYMIFPSYSLDYL